MPDAKPQPEPSMEEIIASISRLIAEDKPQGERLRPAAGAKDDILDLTEAIDEDGTVRRLPPAREHPALPAEPAKETAGPRIEPEPPRVDPAVALKAAGGGERILSAATSGAAAAAFARLGGMPRDQRAEGELLLGDSGRTLEDIVREALRPLLQAWLDKNLPGIVERLVREEIGRVVRDAGLR